MDIHISLLIFLHLLVLFEPECNANCLVTIPYLLSLKVIKNRNHQNSQHPQLEELLLLRKVFHGAAVVNSKSAYTREDNERLSQNVHTFFFYCRVYQMISNIWKVPPPRR